MCARTLFGSAPTSFTNAKGTSTTRPRRRSASRCRRPSLSLIHPTGLLSRFYGRGSSAKYIAVRYTEKVTTEITTAEYRALAELRYRIRRFLSEGDTVARAAGLEPQQYLLLLSLRGLPETEEASIRTLADRLALKHHSTVELIDRLEVRGYVRRTRNRDDRRRVLVSLLPRGERLLE